MKTYLRSSSIEHHYRCVSVFNFTDSILFSICCPWDTFNIAAKLFDSASHNVRDCLTFLKRKIKINTLQNEFEMVKQFGEIFQLTVLCNPRLGSPILSFLLTFISEQTQSQTWQQKQKSIRFDKKKEIDRNVLAIYFHSLEIGAAWSWDCDFWQASVDLFEFLCNFHSLLLDETSARLIWSHLTDCDCNCKQVIVTRYLSLASVWSINSLRYRRKLPTWIRGL